MSNLDKINQLKQRKQKLKSQDSVRTNISLLFDEGSFIELSAFVSKAVLTEGVVTGYGTIDGRLVYLYAQDIDALGGAIGEATTKKVSDTIDMAVKTGAPIIGILNSKGVRIDEGTNALCGIGGNLARAAKASGVVPQITLVSGLCAGSAVFAAGLSDFTFMTEENSSIFLTGPVVTEGLTGVNTDAASLGGAKVCAEKGIAHFALNSDKECISAIKKLLTFLPSNNLEGSPAYASDDDINRLSQNIAELVPEDNSNYDISQLISEVVDDGDVFEVSSAFAKAVFTGFAKLDGVSVGIVANRPNHNEGFLDIDSSKKAASFIRTCDSFNIPIITFVDTPGFSAGIEQEHGGISTYGAALIYAYAEATVPKISVVVKRAFGNAYLAMGAKSVGADFAFAYPFAQISVLAPQTAAGILYNDEISKADDPIAKRAEKTAEYADTTASPFTAVKNGFIDDVIDPLETRQRLISALDVLAAKRDERTPKKHGNMPV